MAKQPHANIRGRIAIAEKEVASTGEIEPKNGALSMDNRSFENVSREKIREILTRNGSVEYAMGVADRYAEQSRQALAAIPDSEYKRALLWVPDFVVAREK